MFTNNPALVDRLVQVQQEEIQREIRAQRSEPIFPASDAVARLGKLIGLLVAAGLLIGLLI